MWDIGSGRELIKLPGYGQSEAKVSSVEFSPDGKSLATAGNSGCKLWDVSTWQERKTLSAGNAPNAAAFSPDGKTIAIAEGSNRLRFFDVATGQEQAVTHAEMGVLHGVAFSRDGKIVAATGQGGAKLWEIVRREGQMTLEVPRTLAGHMNPVGRVAYSPDGTLLATASRSWKNGVVILSDVPKMQLRAIIRDAHVCAFSPDGKTLAAAGTTHVNDEWLYSLKLWDVANVMRPEVLPAQAKAAAAEFINAVRDSGPNQAAGHALVAIVEQEAAVPVLLEGLDDPDDQVREGIVFALRMTGPGAVPALIVACQDKDAHMRAAAAELLGQIGPKAEAAIPALKERLQDGDAGVRQAATYALKAIKMEPMPEPNLVQPAAPSEPVAAKQPVTAPPLPTAEQQAAAEKSGATCDRNKLDWNAARADSCGRVHDGQR